MFSFLELFSSLLDFLTRRFNPAVDWLFHLDDSLDHSEDHAEPDAQPIALSPAANADRDAARLDPLVLKPSASSDLEQNSDSEFTDLTGFDRQPVQQIFNPTSEEADAINRDHYFSLDEFLQPDRRLGFGGLDSERREVSEAENSLLGLSAFGENKRQVSVERGSADLPHHWDLQDKETRHEAAYEYEIDRSGFRGTRFDAIDRFNRANTLEIEISHDLHDLKSLSDAEPSEKAAVLQAAQLQNYWMQDYWNTQNMVMASTPEYNPIYGYGLVDAATMVARAIGQSQPFPAVPDLGGDSWGLDVVNAPEAWAQGYTGQGIVVAVVDTGVDYTHSDLDGNLWVNSDEAPGNGVDDDGNGYVDDILGWDFVTADNNPMDEQGHGTHVAGIVAAENDGAGITGAAYNAKIMPVRVLDAAGSGSSLNVALGIYYAADNGADVINLSLGGGFSSEIASAVQYATEKGSLVVMAAGNEGNIQPTAPAILSFNWGVAVGAIDRNYTVANFSNDSGWYSLDYVVAPGVDILSTTPGNTYQYLSGTSMATPYAAGVAVLALSANPNLLATDLENLLTGMNPATGLMA